MAADTNFLCPPAKVRSWPESVIVPPMFRRLV